MNGINLIPASRLTGRKRRARVRLWIGIAPLCASALAGIYGYLAVSWETRTGDFAAKQEALTAEVEAAKKDIKRDEADARAVSAAMGASKAVLEQPDWGLLLALLGDTLGGETLLSACDVRSADPAGASKDRVRPEHYTLLLSGYSKTQEAVSQFVIALEKLGLFDSVSMRESRRTTLFSADAVEFRVECAITDRGGEGK